MADDEGRTPVIRRTGSVMPGAGTRNRGSSPPGDPYTSAFASSPFGPSGNTSREDYQRGLGFDTDTKKRKDKRREEEAEEAAERRTVNRYASARATAAKSRIYVDGRLVTVYDLFDAEGNPVQIETHDGAVVNGDPSQVEGGYQGPQLSAGQQREFGNRVQARSATYSILGIADLNEDARFIMSSGEQLDADGRGFYDSERGQAMAENALMKGMDRNGSRDAEGRSDSRTGATNMMTLAGGVTWFRQLSRNDPEAYNEMVDLLVGAGYLSDGDARKGVYTIAGGRALAYAAADAAENANAGSKDDLRTFLQKVKDSADASADEERKRNYTPVTRSYTDPEALKATARSAAEDALGRSLTDEEAARFASRFRGLETGMYDKVDSIGRSGEGGAVVGPEAGGQAEAFVRDDEYDEERAGQLVGGYVDALNRMLGA